MRRRWAVFPILLATGCAAKAPRNTEAVALRDGEVAAFVADWGGKDAARIAAHYWVEGRLTIPNSPVMTGPDEIGRGMKGAFADPNWALKMHAEQVDVAVSGDLERVNSPLSSFGLRCHG